MNELFWISATFNVGNCISLLYQLAEDMLFFLTKIIIYAVDSCCCDMFFQVLTGINDAVAKRSLGNC